MKKVFYLAFAVLILSVMCFGVMPARAEVTLNGEWRVRGYVYDIQGEKDASGETSDTASYWDQRFRLYITAKMSDNLKGVVRMLAPKQVDGDFSDVESKWGGGDAVNPKPVYWDIAYLDFDVPLPTAPVNVKLGRQDIMLGNSILLGSSRTFDSLMLNTAIQNVNISLLTVKLDEGNISGAFDDEDLYGAVVSFDPVPNINLGIWAVLGKDGDTGGSEGYMVNAVDGVAATNPSLDAFWMGAAANMDLPPMKINVEFDYSKVTLNGEWGNPDIESTGYAFYADVAADIPTVKFGGSLLYTTGEDKDETNHVTDNDLFIPISSYFSERNDYDYMVLRRYIYSRDNGIFSGDHSIGNIIAIKLYAMKDLAPKLMGMVSAQNYSFTQDPDGSSGWMGKNLGTEIDVKLVYKLYNNLTITGVGAYWITDEDTFDMNQDGDVENNWLLKQEILYKF